MGGQLMNITTHTDFIREKYPNLQYLISVCTGAGILARSGVLDGRNATTNKKVWDMVTALGPNVKWKSPARWVVDGNIWTSSGVTAGMDLIYAFIEEMYGATAAWNVQAELEYDRKTQCDDKWSAIQGVKPTWDCVER
jgi:transcriptional regulator GlxA family with amidase domain